jgi:hypothetical protein
MWFEVDKEGLSKILEHRGKEFTVFELLQNAWDENSTSVTAELSPIPDKHQALLRVSDDNPEGFCDLRHAWTLFAESPKKGNPEKRGRFDMGEKLVLALCVDGKIISTTGGVVFDEDGRHRTREKTERGTLVELHVKMTRDEIATTVEAVKQLIPPEHISTTFNGKKLERPKMIRSIEMRLPTFVADAEGCLRPTIRTTQVEVFLPREGEKAKLYEMGIPVVETGDKYHYNVCQKVPLNMDRDNVPPAYLQTLRTLALNETFDLLDKEEANDPWVRAASADKRCKAEATSVIADFRFGQKRVAYDPSDPEANNAAVANGYTLVTGGMASKQEWDNMKAADLIRPAGQVCPRKVQFGGTADEMMDDELSVGMKEVRRYTVALAKKLFGENIRVVFLKAKGLSATYGSRTITFYVHALGKNWFNLESNAFDIDRLLLHEFGHEFGHHLEDSYHKAICRFGAMMRKIALTEPKFFDPKTYG